MTDSDYTVRATTVDTCVLPVTEPTNVADNDMVFFMSNIIPQTDSPGAFIRLKVSQP